VSAKLFVSNLPYACAEDDLRVLFESAGVVPVSVRVVVDRGTGLSRGFGFVEVSTHDQAMRARAALSGATIGDRNLVVDLAKPSQGGGGKGPPPPSGRRDLR
jgi:RNA recognition motif-containing protein